LPKLRLKDPAPADLTTEDEPRPGRARKPLGWSMITIGVLVAASATLVGRRDGISGVLEIGRTGGRLFHRRGSTPIRRRRAAGAGLCDRLGVVCLQRVLLWEIPFMPARFAWFRAAVSVPFPFLAAAIAMAIGKP
jgi:hypothetical protein